MSGLNVEWALAELDKLSQQTVVRNASSSGAGWVSISDDDLIAAFDVEVIQQAPIVEQILDRVLPRWHTEAPSDSANNGGRAIARRRSAPGRSSCVSRGVKENLGHKQVALE